MAINQIYWRHNPQIKAINEQLGSQVYPEYEILDEHNELIGAAYNIIAKNISCQNQEEIFAAPVEDVLVDGDIFNPNNYTCTNCPYFCPGNNLPICLAFNRAIFYGKQVDYKCEQAKTSYRNRQQKAINHLMVKIK